MSRSQSLDGYVNRRDENAAKKLERLRDLENRINASTIQIYNITVAFNDAVEDCEEEERNRLARLKRKQAFTKILGTGLAVGGKILAGGTGGPTDWQSVWEDRDSIAGQGNTLGTALNWLFASAEDFPKICTQAIRLQHDGDTEKERLKSLHQSYAVAVKEAELATGQEITGQKTPEPATDSDDKKEDDKEQKDET